MTNAAFYGTLKIIAIAIKIQPFVLFWKMCPISFLFLILFSFSSFYSFSFFSCSTEISSSGFIWFRNSCIFLFVSPLSLHSHRGYVRSLVTKGELYPFFISIPSKLSCSPQFISWSGKTPSTFLMSLFFHFAISVQRLVQRGCSLSAQSEFYCSTFWSYFLFVKKNTKMSELLEPLKIVIFSLIFSFSAYEVLQKTVKNSQHYS